MAETKVHWFSFASLIDYEDGSQGANLHEDPEIDHLTWMNTTGLVLRRLETDVMERVGKFNGGGASA